MEIYVSNTVRDTAETVAATLEGAIIFYSADEAGAVVMQFNADGEGGTYVVDIDENGNTRSAMMPAMETGWEA